jgi:hypothetical protein
MLIKSAKYAPAGNSTGRQVKQCARDHIEPAFEQLKEMIVQQAVKKRKDGVGYVQGASLRLIELAEEFAAVCGASHDSCSSAAPSVDTAIVNSFAAFVHKFDTMGTRPAEEQQALQILLTAVAGAHTEDEVPVTHLQQRLDIQNSKTFRRATELRRTAVSTTTTANLLLQDDRGWGRE